MSNQQKVGAIIVAAGESQRMGGIDKILATLGGEPLLTRTTRPFQDSPLVGQIVVAVSSSNEEKCQHIIGGEDWSKVTEVCLGGRRRQDSVAAGLKHLKPCDWVIVHDGARPMVTADLIRRGLEAARETGAAAAAVPVTDTVKITGADEIVRQTLRRENLWAVQTPQVFRFDIITEACQKIKDDVTDDASMVELAGYKVKLYMGSYDNIKVTTPDDLALAGVLWRKRET